MGGAFGGEEIGAGRIGFSGLFPLAGEDVNGFVGVGVHVGRDGDSGVEFAEHDDATGDVVLLQDEEFDACVRAGLPGFLSGGCDVWEHGGRSNACGLKLQALSVGGCGAARARLSGTFGEGSGGRFMLRLSEVI
jgi:hypothetical protein